MFYCFYVFFVFSIFLPGELINSLKTNSKTGKNPKGRKYKPGNFQVTNYKQN